MKKSKKQLLNTKMNKLGLPKLVVNHFYHPRDSEDNVVTLKEFFEMNHELFTQRTAFFTKRIQIKRFLNNFAHIHGFLKKSKAWQILREFLLENNFTHRDCIHLIEKEHENVFLLSKKQILSLPVEDIFPKDNVFYQIIEYLYGQEPVSDYYKYKGSYDRAMKNYATKMHGTTVAQILALTGKDIDLIFNKNDSFWRQYRMSLHNLQQKFKSWGLTKYDGPFMSLYLYPTCHTKKEFIIRLTTENGFTVSEARMAAELGKKAGWIYYKK